MFTLTALSFQSEPIGLPPVTDDINLPKRQMVRQLHQIGLDFCPSLSWECGQWRFDKQIVTFVFAVIFPFKTQCNRLSDRD
ncbi:MAG TPA: hypothetical protein VFE80_16250 [Beijerinckiaceae bacterium]|nr:hypothetical protein [Beijerinckiaceae bacterium]HZY23942.1 hypothetical protein [Beijerinckiaceae bacterium]